MVATTDALTVVVVDPCLGVQCQEHAICQIESEGNTTCACKTCEADDLDSADPVSFCGIPGIVSLSFHSLCYRNFPKFRLNQWATFLDLGRFYLAFSLFALLFHLELIFSRFVLTIV